MDSLWGEERSVVTEKQYVLKTGVTGRTGRYPDPPRQAVVETKTTAGEKSESSGCDTEVDVVTVSACVH